MFVPLFFLIASLRTLYGSPVNSSQTLAQDFDSFPIQINTRDTSLGVSNHVRTTYDIFWSCAVTLIACVWSAIHPNLSAPRDSGWKVAKRQVTTALYALIAPELIALWALRQYSSAESIAEQYNEEFLPVPRPQYKRPRWKRALVWVLSVPLFMCIAIRSWFTDLEEEATRRRNPEQWTQTHGFFVQMGGFMLYNGEMPESVLGFEVMCKMIKANEIAKPTVTEAEIQDRSKGNALSKAVVVFQTSWFVVQCLARVANSLPLSELEVVTLGFAVLNTIIYAVWWNKPQAVGVAVCIPRLRDTQETGVGTVNAQETGAVDTHRETSTLSRESEKKNWLITHPWRPLWKLYRYKSDDIPKDPLRVPMFNFTLLTESNRPASIAVSSPSQPADTIQSADTRENIQLAEITQPTDRIQPAGDTQPAGNTIPADIPINTVMQTAQTAANVNNQPEDNRSDQYTACLIGAIFGAVHFFGWASAFPSRAEQIIWHVSVPIITAVPLLIVLALAADKYISTGEENEFRLIDLLGTILYALVILGMLAYILARIALLTVAFLSLRALPPQVFIQIRWTFFLPHY